MTETSVSHSLDHAMAIGGWFNNINVVDYSTGNEIFSVSNTRTHSGFVQAKASPSHILCSENSNSPASGVSCYDVLEKRKIFTLEHPNGVVDSLCHCPGGHLATAAKDKVIRLWDLETKQMKCGLRGHENELIFGLCSIDDKSWLCSGSHDKTAKIWDLSTESELKSINEGAGVYSTAWNPDSNTVFIGGATKKVNVYSLTDFRKVRSFQHSHRVISMLILQEENLLIVGNSVGEIRVWDLRQETTPLQTMKVHYASVRDICRLRDGLFASASQDKTVKIWKRDHDEALFSFDQPSFPYCVSPLYASSADSNALLRSVTDISDRLETIFSIGCLLAAIRSGGTRLAVSAALTGGSPFIIDDRSEVELEDLTQELRLTKDDFMRCLLGDIIDEKHLYVLFEVFRELHLFRWAHACCAAVKSISRGSVLVLLASQCFATSASIVGADYESDSEGSDDLDPFAEYSAFTIAVLRQIRRHRAKFKKSLRRTKCLTTAGSLLLLDDAHPIWAKPLSEHADFGGTESLPDSFAAAASLRLAELHETREFSNVTLTTSDGGEEKAHVEILVARSGLFSGMLHFGGREVTEFKRTGAILVEDISAETLRQLIRWIYLRSIEDCRLSSLLELLVYAEMYDDKPLSAAARRCLAFVLREKSCEDLVSWILEDGWRTKILPDAVGAFVTRLCDSVVYSGDKKRPGEAGVPISSLFEHSIRSHEANLRIQAMAAAAAEAEADARVKVEVEKAVQEKEAENERLRSEIDRLRTK